MSNVDWRLHPFKGHHALYYIATKAIVDGQAREKANRRPDGQESFGDIAGPQHISEAGERERDGAA